tara:strand:- start:1537 stop:1848 length:312 start_codon:yes stop_codon:yes gene_type:complete
MFTLNRVNRNALAMIVLLLLVISALTAFRATTSKYQFKPITTKTVSEQSIFDLPVSIECTAGSGKKDSPYSKGLTPGGVCGAQKLVNDHSGYEITDGIGGSLI